MTGVIEDLALLFNFKYLTKGLQEGTFIDSSENAKLTSLHSCITNSVKVRTLVANSNMPFWYLDSKNTKVYLS